MDFPISPELIAPGVRSRQFIAGQAIPFENDARQDSHGPSAVHRWRMARKTVRGTERERGAQ
ncbi:hypothetical protein [Zeimonas arvi]|uniref:Uncharacterized protein n=1 Tax=Zeimonas arvi TaxID=2498847 RepID=A0A5C8NRS5_9BURK|nr:hypothetical protein [Zeimonas arvi]TXL63525.1 hypothetical protein FHP08_16930 [Zeimonas arvi]